MKTKTSIFLFCFLLLSSIFAQTETDIFNEDWESGIGSWTTETNNPSYWHVDSYNAYGGSGDSWWMADPTIGSGGGYSDNWYQVLDTDPIVLSGSDLTLSFYHRFSGETGSSDGMNIRISTDDGNTWEVITSVLPAYNCTNLYSFEWHGEGANIPGLGGSLTSWTSVEADLSAYIGETVILRFAFASDPGYSTTNDNSLFGWQIDNIEVTNSTSTLFSNNGVEGNLTPHSKYAEDLWHIADESGNQYASCNNESDTYLKNMDNSIVSDFITLPDQPSINMDFEMRGTFENASLNISVLVEGDSDPTSIMSLNDTEVSGTWSLLTDMYSAIDLSSYRNQNIKLIFSFNCDFWNNPVGTGIQLDNIRVYYTDSPPPPSPDERQLFISDSEVGENIDRIVKADLTGGNFTELSANEDIPTSVFFNPNEGNMYWANEGIIKKAHYDGVMTSIESPENVLTDASTPLKEVQMDLNRNKMYWINSSGIQKSDIDGNNQSTIISGTITGFTLDVGNERIYYIEGANVKSASIVDGTYIEDLATLSGTNVGIDFDPYTQAIFFSNNGAGKIGRIQLPEKSISEVVTGLANIQNLVCEEDDGKLYLSLGSSGSTQIYRVAYDGSSGEEIVASTELNTAIGLQILDINNEPSTQSSSVTISNVQEEQVNISWTRGDGERCVVFMREGHDVPNSPNHGAFYNEEYDGGGNSTYGLGTNLYGLSTWYCVYNGTGDAVVVNGLSAGTDYTVSVYEYNGRNGYEFYNWNEDVNYAQETTAGSGTPSLNDDRLYISVSTGVPNNDKILVSNLDGSSIQDFLTTEDRPSSMFFDKRTDRSYWTNVNIIRERFYNGSDYEVHDLVTDNNNPYDAQVNVFGDRLFWRNDNGIIRTQMDGTPDPETQPFIAGTITGFTLDVGNNRIYYVDRAENKIKSATLNNGDDIQTLTDISTGNTKGIDFDPYQQAIYYSENSGGSVIIKKIELPNTVSEVYTPSGLTDIGNLCVDQVTHNVYYIGLSGREVYMYDGSNSSSIVTLEEGVDVSGLAVYYQTHEPSTQATSVSFSAVEANQATINWTNGNGERRAVFMKAADCGPCGPINHGIFYCCGGNEFGGGTPLEESGWYCVYNDNGESVTVTGLIPQTDYIAMVYEYNGMNGFEVYNFDDSENSAITSTPLPVELTSFEAELVDNNVLLQWKTATEVNNYGFDIERAIPNPIINVNDSLEWSGWSKIGFVQGNGTTNSPKGYSFTDLELPHSNKVRYRLKQIDNDGTFSYSKTITVEISSITGIDEKDKQFQFTLNQNYPNPFNPSTIIKYSLKNRSRVSIKIFNILGEVVADLVNGEQAIGSYEIKFNATSLSSGVYFYSLYAESNTSKETFRDIKKMILLR